MGTNKSCRRGWRKTHMKKKLLHLTVNEEHHELHISPKKLLVEILRDELGLTGTKRGCSTGSCGACTVLLDGAAIKSCSVLAIQADGARITTVEGLAAGAKLTPLQLSFLDLLDDLWGQRGPLSQPTAAALQLFPGPGGAYVTEDGFLQLPRQRITYPPRSGRPALPGRLLRSRGDRSRPRR